MTNHESGQEEDEKLEARRPFHQHPLIRSVLATLVLCGIVVVVIYWLHARQYEVTDDAFVDGEVVQISAKVSGIIESVDVQDNQDVPVGTVLARIDPRDLQARLNEAKATLAEAKAGVEQARAAIQSSKSQVASAQADVLAAEADAVRRQADLKRYRSLDPRSVSQQQLDVALAASDAAEANLVAARKRVLTAEASVMEAQAKEAHALATVDGAKAVVDAVELTLSYTTIRAPVAGRVTRRTAREGQYVQVGQIVLAVVRSDVWVTANFKETQIAHMCQGQDVDIKVDSYPSRIFHGKVDSIQAGTGSRFSMLPPENASGNYIKVIQRVPVKILFDPDATHQWLLAPGMSVIPRVRVGRSGQARPRPIVALTVHAMAPAKSAVPSAAGESC